MKTEHNLLFGVLAMQLELIDSKQFAEACAAWAVRKDVPMAEVLLERGWLKPVDRQIVEQLIERKVLKHNGDTRVTLASVADFGVRDVIRDSGDTGLRDSLNRLPPGPGCVLLSTAATPMEEGSLFSTAMTPIDLRSRYTVTRLHAEGGLGRVFVARDNDLNRDVALKELKPEQTRRPDICRRFLKEAQVTGQLEHPNIVPVYELARRPEDNGHFYTMRLVRGQTLREAIAQYHQRRKEKRADPVEWAQLLGAFVTVCQAVSYAHSRGVVHRDLKPENVMLGAFGEVVLLDWGLARMVDRPDEDELAPPVAVTEAAQVAATLPGRPLGTPAYMAPEQAEGRVDLIDSRTDIYGLGAILFEILTSRPPHEGSNTAEVIRRIVTSETPRAKAVDLSVPAALDAVCSKAMSKSRAGRYARALDLAQDVQRFLADEPVSVYAEPLTARLARWGRRHRKWTLAGAAAMLAVTVISVAAALLVNEARRQAETARRAETAAKQDAARRFRDAIDATDTWLTGVTYVLNHYPGLEEVHEPLLQKAADYYGRFATEKSDDVELRAGSGQAFVRLGDVGLLLNRLAQAEQAYGSAESLFETLTQKAPSAQSHHLDLAKSRTKRGIARAGLGQPAEAEQSFQSAIAGLRAVIKEPLDQAEYLDALGTSLIHYGSLLQNLGRHADAEKLLQEAVQQFESLEQEHPGVARYRQGLATARNALGQLLSAIGRNAEAVALFRKEIAVLDELVAADADVLEYRETRAMSYVNLGNALRLSGQAAEETKAYQVAIADYEALSKSRPGVPYYREQLALTRIDFGQLLAQMGHTVEAKKQLDAGLQSIGVLVEAYPSFHRYRNLWAAGQNSLGQVLSDLGLNAEAEAAHRDALQGYQKLLEKYDEPAYQEGLALSRVFLGQHLHKLGRHDDARDAFRVGIDELRSLIREEGSVPSYRDQLAWGLVYQGDLLWDMGSAKEAGAAYREARELWEKLAAESAEPEYLYHFAWFLVGCRDPELRDPARAAKEANRAVERLPQSADYRNVLGVALYRQGDWKRSLEALQEAGERRPQGDSRDQFYLAMVHWKLGNKDEASKHYRQAIELMEKNRPGNAELKTIRAEAAGLLKE